MFKKKTILRTPQQMIQEAEQKVTDAFIMFQQAHDAVEEADKANRESIEENDKRLVSLDAQVKSVETEKQRALDNLKANAGVKARLLEFIPQK